MQLFWALYGFCLVLAIVGLSYTANLLEARAGDLGTWISVLMLIVHIALFVSLVPVIWVAAYCNDEVKDVWLHFLQIDRTILFISCGALFAVWPCVYACLRRS